MSGRVVAQAAAPVLDAGATLGEGPRWDAAAGLLHWLDIAAGTWHRFDPACGAREPRRLGTRLSALLPRRGGGHVAAVDGSLLLLDRDGATVRRIALLPPVGDLVLNDAACDARGRLWIGTASRAGRPDGALLRVDPAGTAAQASGAANASGAAAPRVTVMRAGIRMSNGIGWSPDGRTLYHVDSAAGTLAAIPFEPQRGTLGAPRTLLVIDPREGVPDGLAVDAEGTIWLAIWGAGEVRACAPDGRPRGAVATPGAAQTTSCALGDGRLWITTAREGLTAAQAADQPAAGSLFATPLDLPGQPAHAFAA